MAYLFRGATPLQGLGRPMAAPGQGDGRHDRACRAWLREGGGDGREGRAAANCVAQPLPPSAAPRPAAAMASRAQSSFPQTRRFEEKRELDPERRGPAFQRARRAAARPSPTSPARSTWCQNSVTYYYRKKEDLAAACFVRATAAFDRIATAAGAWATPWKREFETLPRFCTPRCSPTSNAASTRR